MKPVIAIFWFLLFPLLMALMTPAHSAELVGEIRTPVRKRKIEMKVLRHPHDDKPGRDQAALTAKFLRRLDELVAAFERNHRISGKLVVYITPEFYPDAPEQNQFVLHCPELYVWYDIPLAGRSLTAAVQDAFRYIPDIIRLSREFDRMRRAIPQPDPPPRARSGYFV